MTPKEKAEELAGKYWDLNYGWDGVTKDAWATEGALIAVDEIIELYEFHAISNPDDKRVMDTLNYFDEVKQELNKL
jgi:hypothetical protein